MKQVIHHRATKFISSHEMENSETQERIINLGKALVKELGLDPGVDTLARWMAHYVAEQMTISENTIGNDKHEAEQHCFETILKLWKHRAYLPNERRPFESFEPIFRALERLDPETSTPFYYPESRSSQSDNSNGEADEVQEWLDLAEVIDKAARVCLESIFLQAASKATDEKTIEWLVNAVDTHHDISLIVHLIDREEENENEEIAEQKRKAEQAMLESRIKQLDSLIDFAQHLRRAFLEEIEKTA